MKKLPVMVAVKKDIFAAKTSYTRWFV